MSETSLDWKLRHVNFQGHVTAWIHPITQGAMTVGGVEERNQDATIYVGGLDEKTTESILWELFLQAGPVVNVHMPKDRITMQHQGYGFVEFMTEEDADYAMRIMNMIKLFGKPIRVNKASANQKNLDIGANIFIGNLDPEVDEKLLYDTFSAFGVILQTPKIMRDPETGNSKGYAFINFASFEASDAAIEAMNGQYLCNRAITISYAFKKDSKGERHGSAAERLLAAQSPLSQVRNSQSIGLFYSFFLSLYAIFSVHFSGIQCEPMSKAICRFIIRRFSPYILNLNPSIY
ncbi:Splicing factor 3B subunit 4 [Clonorchis sinensis]|uniref:Splicing factor 3B subunit 4 n=1 Tax=Clonorchis sinensis TaxID=79923 RepID=A0A419PI32_CLOSI|nr:Splicing factor 3B subunit 4 [Clonorchis sinensis]